MAYSKTTWVTGDVVTATKLNHAEDGIATAQSTAEGAAASVAALGANGAIDTANLADASVTNAKLDQESVDTDNIRNGAITTPLIYDGAVTRAKLADAALADIATEYSSSSTYAVGDYVFHSGALYRCVSAITTAEAWTAAHWKQITLGDDVSDLKSAITNGELTQLVKNGNFADSSNWLATFGTLSVSNNEATVTVSNANNCQFYQQNIGYTSGHIYLIKLQAKGSKNGNIAYSGIYSAGEKILLPLSTSYKDFSFIWSAKGTPQANFHFWIARNGWSIQDFGVGDSVTFKNMMLFDLTAMFGKNNEPNKTEFLNVYNDSYYDYNKPTAYPVRDFHNTGFDSLQSRFNVANRFDKNEAMDGYYVAAGGVIGTIANYSISRIIYIGDLDYFSYSYTFRLSFYDDDFAWVSDPTTQNTVGTVATVAVPSTVKYVIIAYQTSYVDYVQCGSNIDVNNYVPYGAFTMPNLIIGSSDSSKKVTVSKSNRGDYSSLLEALYERDCDVEVLDGAYDIVAEFKAKFGNTFFDDNVDRSSAGDFKLGLYITNRTLKFDANTSISFDLSDNPASNDGGDDRRFSLFNLGVNAVLDGAVGTTNYNWYAIHDDGAGGDYASNYKNVIKNCVISSSNMVNNNSIGGGFGRYSETDIDNCYFDNGGDNSTYTIRYHNTWNGQAQPVCHVQNTYCNGKIGFWKYGSSTKVGICTVNNCSMIGTADLNTIGGAAENLRILQWANDNRS